MLIIIVGGVDTKGETEKWYKTPPKQEGISLQISTENRVLYDGNRITSLCVLVYKRM